MRNSRVANPGRCPGAVAAALDYALSQGVVHRDVKLGNAMVRKDGTPFVPDFGIARKIQVTMTVVTGKVAGGTREESGRESTGMGREKFSNDWKKFTRARMAHRRCGHVLGGCGILPRFQARDLQGTREGMGAAGSRTSGSSAMVVQDVQRRFRWCGILSRRCARGAAGRAGGPFSGPEKYFAITGKSMVFHDFPHGEAHEGVWIAAGYGEV